jgi:hypothetical protein
VFFTDALWVTRKRSQVSVSLYSIFNRVSHLLSYSLTCLHFSHTRPVYTHSSNQNTFSILSSLLFLDLSNLRKHTFWVLWCGEKPPRLNLFYPLLERTQEPTNTTHTHVPESTSGPKVRFILLAHSYFPSSAFATAPAFLSRGET